MPKRSQSRKPRNESRIKKSEEETRPAEEDQNLTDAIRAEAASAKAEAPKEKERMAEKEEEPSSKEPGERGDKERPATEKPIPSQSRLTQYIVSVDEMGYARKIEKLNEATGERKELSNEEYAAAYSLASSVAPYYAHCATTMYDPLHSAAMQNYVKSVSDYLEYLKTLTQKR